MAVAALSMPSCLIDGEAIVSEICLKSYAVCITGSVGMRFLTIAPV
jgi:hypothetical protein